jgi:hypothetical protein
MVYLYKRLFSEPIVASENYSNLKNLLFYNNPNENTCLLCIFPQMC